MFHKRRCSASNSQNSRLATKFYKFLESDIWAIPINDFEERNSIVFDGEQSEQHLRVYSLRYKEFSDLVNSLIQSYCQDTGVEASTLTEALRMHDSAANSREKLLLEPIVAAQNFNVFVPMMMRKNIEVQLQVLKLMEARDGGSLPAALRLNEEDAEIWKGLGDEDESERLILLQVLKQSRDEWNRNRKIWDLWQHQLDSVMENSRRETDQLEAMIRSEQRKVEEAIQSVDDKFANLQLNSATSSSMVQPPTMLLKEAASSSRATTTRQGAGTRAETPPDHRDISSANRGLSLNPPNISRGVPMPDNQQLYNTGYEYRSLLKEREDLSDELVRNREAYLREQRDKLLERKRHERGRLLKQESTMLARNERPRTAQAAASALSRGALDAGKNSSSSVDTDGRRAIAAKIKVEVLKSTSKQEQ